MNQLLVGELFHGGRRNAPRNLLHLRVSCAQLLPDVVEPLVGINGVTTGVEVDRRVAVLRPGVHGDVGFGNNHHNRNAVRGEAVGRGVHDRRSCHAGSGIEDFLEPVQIVQHSRIAAGEFGQEVRTEYFQGGNPHSFRFFKNSSFSFL